MRLLASWRPLSTNKNELSVHVKNGGKIECEKCAEIVVIIGGLGGRTIGVE